MSIRITKLKINRNGPLNSDFELSPGDLNLIYGYNETGKTYIVETMIQFLFKHRKYPLTLRDWNYGGRILVSGINAQSVSFTKTGEKLDNYTDNEQGFPQDIAKLLVVRSGETRFSKEEDGVGRDIIRNYLSGKGILEEILKPLPTTSTELKIENKSLIGDKRSPHKKEIVKTLTDRDKLTELIDEIETNDSLARISSLEEESTVVSSRIDELEKAKCSYASKLNSEIESIDDELEKLPKPEEIQELKEKINILNRNIADRKGIAEEVEKREETAEDYDVCNIMLQRYNQGLNEQRQTKESKWMLVLGILLVLGALACALLEQTVPLVLCVVISSAFLILYGVTKKSVSNQGYIEEQSKRESEFNDRFGIELSSKDILESKFKELQKEKDLAEASRTELIKKDSEIQTERNNIAFKMKNLSEKEIEEASWIKELNILNSSIEKCTSRKMNLREILLPLNVSPSDYIQNYSGVKWNSIELEKQNTILMEIQQKKEELATEIDKLKGRIAVETGKSHTESIETLIGGLYDKRQQAVNAYKKICGETLAIIKVVEVVNQLLETEDELIRENLRCPSIATPLASITDGKYTGINMGDNGELSLITDDDEEFPLLRLSKGAREQIYLALRAGFAKRVFKDPAFLILDDAFQHSDYKRRQNLVDHAMKLVNEGWQIFYFTMDEHMQNLFQKAGKSLGDKFKEVCL